MRDMNNIYPSPNKPRQVAERLLHDLWNDALAFSEDDFYVWSYETGWILRPKELIRQDVVDHLGHQQYSKRVSGSNPPSFEQIDFQPTTGVVANVMLNLEGMTAREKIAYDGKIVLQNGIFDLKTRELSPLTPDRFEVGMLPFSYDPEADCPLWDEFLEEQLEPQERVTLCEAFGYILSGRTDLQKFFYFVGPPGTGKSTALDVLLNLVGTENTAALTFDSFRDTYGLWSLLDKRLATIDDARFSGDLKAPLERLLSITGQARIPIQRKYRSTVHATLSARFVIASNELPIIPDSSSALDRRLVLIPFEKRILHYDPWIARRLSRELSGIFNWALRGMERIEESNTFTTSGRALDLKESTALASSPIQLFIKELVPMPGNEVSNSGMYRHYVNWCEFNGYRPSGSQTFHSRMKQYLLPPFEAWVRNSQRGYSGMWVAEEERNEV